MKPKVVDGFFRHYENSAHACICTDQHNVVVSVENIGSDNDIHIETEDGPYVVLTPGTKASFGSLRLTREQLKLAYRTRPLLNYEDEETP
jgi:hypothetical protein